MATQNDFDAFIAAIDTSVAGIDRLGFDLRFHVSSAAEQNAADTFAGDDDLTDDQMEIYWDKALSTAAMVADDWQTFFPQLIKGD
jgi:hypothetical protein